MGSAETKKRVHGFLSGQKQQGAAATPQRIGLSTVATIRQTKNDSAKGRRQY